VVKQANCYSSATLIAVSADGEAFAYGMRNGGRDELRIFVVETATGRVRGELPDFKMSRSMLLPDLSGYLYILLTKSGWCIYRHDFESSRADRALFGPVHVPNACCLSAQASPETKLLLIRSYPDGLRGVAEYCFVDQQTKAISSRFRFEHKFFGQFFGRQFFVLTDWNAPNKRILAAETSDPSPARWREVVSEDTMPIQRFTVVGRMLFVNYTDGFSSEVRMYTRKGHLKKKLELPPNGSASTPTGTISSKNTFYEFSSLTCPHTVFRFHIQSRKQDVWHRSAVPFEFEAVKNERVWYTSSDGTCVPMTLTFRRDTVPGPAVPVMLTAYGGFGVSETPRFTQRSALWIEMGGIFAKANIRGGGEFGEEWHRAAIRDKRQKAFDDFIAAAEWLIANRYTTSRRLAAVGGSNSGLLVGAALVQRPDLFAAVICFGPILDLLRYHFFPGSEVALNEYGSADNPEEANYLRRLSPYHNVVDGVCYPAVLFVSGDADTRCHPMHARKMCARLQEATASKRPILLDYHEQRGHAGFLPLQMRVETLTQQFCFLLNELDLSLDSNGRVRSVESIQALRTAGDC
jgi:prolyl oligopeptidase